MSAELGSGLIIDTFDSGTTKMTTTKSYDSLNRLTSTRSVAQASLPVTNSFSYTYNSANQRTQSALADGSYWTYSYDSLGQVTGGQKYWSDNTPVAGEQFGYAFDTIGNRQSITANGNAGTYTANNLNQCTQRSVPGAVWETGNAASNATVTVNLQNTSRHGSYFADELSVANSSSAVYTQLTTVGVLKNGGSASNDVVSSATGHVFVAKSPEMFGYDADGNLTNDGRFSYQWDGENRLVGVETAVSAVSAGAPHQKLLFGYDYMSRRISKVVSNFNGSTWSAVTTLKFVYDRWNLVSEVDVTNGIVRFYTWGLDLSGSPQGAGGIGGLLAVNLGSNGTHFVAYDGNGNVIALLDGNTGNISAQYEYGPFGQTIRLAGVASSVNPYRFSTQFTDTETELLCYDYRYFTPSAGRWLNRDPIEERFDLQISPNLYDFVANNPISNTDPDGRITVKTVTSLGAIESGSKCGSWSVDFKFWLDNKPWSPGYIVQKVTDHRYWTTCFGSFFYEDYDFWEYQPVSAEGAGAVDTSHEKSHTCSYGTASVITEIRWFPLSITGPLNWGGNGESEHASSQKPIWWDFDTSGWEAPSGRSVISSWYCINNSSSTVYVWPPPS